jgi:hypothetical protein
LAAQKVPALENKFLTKLFSPDSSNSTQFCDNDTPTATMVNKGPLKMALAADKNTDYKKQNLKKKEKLARKNKSKKGGDTLDVGKIVEGEWEDVGDTEGEDVLGEDTVASALNVTSNADLSSSEEEEDDEVAGKMEVYLSLSIDLNSPNKSPD